MFDKTPAISASPISRKVLSWYRAEETVIHSTMAGTAKRPANFAKLSSDGVAANMLFIVRKKARAKTCSK